MSSGFDDTLHATGGSPAVKLNVGDLFAGRYEVQGVLGVGGMGAVYRVRDAKLDEVVALKLLTLESESAIERFVREVRLARRVTHPNVARTHDFGEHDGVRFLTMELVEGTDLQGVLARRGKLPADEASAIGVQIARGLQAAHGAGVVHRDLKPGNVLVADDGRVVLTDFGIARAASGGSNTKTGAMIGTPHYMAPEQVTGNAADARADIYALGLMLYELLTGTLPFSGDHVIAIVTARLHQQPEDPRRRAAVPDALAGFVMRCLARDPDQRPASAADVVAALSGARAPATETRSYAPIALGPRAVAVLPFSYRGSQEHGYLAEGLAEELIDVLSRNRDLRVLALGATRRFADDRDPARIGAELGAQAIVDGTLQHAGERVRLSARLVEPDGLQRWSDSFDGRLQDVFELQESMGRQVAEALRVEIDAAAWSRTAPPEAIEGYLRARRINRSGSITGTEEAVGMLEHALVLAPDFSPAIAAHAIASVRALWSRERDVGGARVKRAERSVERARQQAPDIAETHMATAMAAVQAGRFREAAMALSRALEIAPTMAEAHQYLGDLQLEAGRPREGEKHVRLALELDPSQTLCHVGLARRALLIGDEEAFQRHRAALREAHPNPTLATTMSQLRWAMYRDDEAEVRSLVGQLSSIADEAGQLLSAFARIALGGCDDALAERYFQTVPAWIDNDRFATLLYQMGAELFLVGGEEGHAMRALKEAAARTLVDIEWVDRCPLVAPLRGDPEFEAVAAAVRARATSVWR